MSSSSSRVAEVADILPCSSEGVSTCPSVKSLLRAQGLDLFMQITLKCIPLNPQCKSTFPHLEMTMLVILRWRRHRAFQLIQKTLHSGTTIFCPLRSVPLRFVLCCGCQCDPWVGSIFLYIVGNTARWQWRCCILCREEISKYMVLYLTFLHYLHHYWCEQALSVSICLPVLE